MGREEANGDGSMVGNGDGDGARTKTRAAVIGIDGNSNRNRNEATKEGRKEDGGGWEKSLVSVKSGKRKSTRSGTALAHAVSSL